MTRDLKIRNAMDIACSLSMENVCKHLDVCCTPAKVELSLYFDLYDENLKVTKERIKRLSTFVPKYDNLKFFDDGFEVLQMTWFF